MSDTKDIVEILRECLANPDTFLKEQANMSATLVGHVTLKAAIDEIENLRANDDPYAVQINVGSAMEVAHINQFRNGTSVVTIKRKPRTVWTKHCSECGEPQFNTPSGITCKNGHGGSPAKEDL